jgi:carbon monoxide dehydrogenase subunit G
MEYEGSETIPAPREAVWEPITDPEALTQCVMGAQEVERVSERRYEGVITQSVGGITVSIDGAVAIETLDSPERLTFTATGSDDRTNARMDADVEVVLAADGRETTMEYAVDIRFTGKLATLGSRILRRQIKANVETYFDNLAEYAGESG